MSQSLRILRSYRITEKAASLNANLNKYVFEVEPTANRIEVGRAVAERFKTKVARVNILNRRGKMKSGRSMGGHAGRTVGRKLAIVTLQAGQKIEIV